MIHCRLIPEPVRFWGALAVCGAAWCGVMLASIIVDGRRARRPPP